MIFGLLITEFFFLDSPIAIPKIPDIMLLMLPCTFPHHHHDLQLLQHLIHLSEQETLALLMHIPMRMIASTSDQFNGKIAKKAPHHSLDSWKSYYKRRANLVDTIFAKAQEYVNVIPTAEQGSKHVPAGSSPLTSSSNEDNDDSDSNLSSIPGDEPRTEDDARNMGETGGPYTDADLRIVAKFIALTSDWDERLRHEKWEPFQDKYPGRGYRSWAEFYRRQAPAIDRLVRKYKRRDQRNAAAKNATNPTIVEPAENQITMNPLKRKADLQPHGIDPSAVSAKRRHTAPNPGARQKPLNTSTGLTSQVASSKGKERAVEVEVDVIDLTILDEDFKEEDF
ncbi:hypothetical protein SCP_0412990 [Sparassis crispa]|uniref:Uncharacterized protein n=1 Tax=Sparassis crispa TaxID=139825 RepID=A0A401GL91_9APHY|nr:hypothetical protein SCP_0412990 [Sparassis crispa]GBE82912.1 hypothetical protein SCP_0412990 [Sparassis crispa]